MENIRAEMMAEIQQLKTRQGGGRMEEVMREAATTPLTAHLAKALNPQNCPIPAFECYDGCSDPAAHLRYFPSILKGSTLSWFDNLPPNSIDSYIQLTEKFLRTYMYNKAVNAEMDKLFSLAVAYKETIREYTDRWHKIYQAIGNVDPVVSINFYKWGLDRMSPLFVEIHGSVPTTEGDIRVIIENHARLEEIQRENPRAQTQRYHRINSVEKASGSKRRNSVERSNEDKRGQRDDRRSDDRKFEDQFFTKLNTNYTRILREIKNRENLEWLWFKGKQPPRSEKSRDYCEYHCFNGHQTEKCKNLKIIIQKLIDAGDLKQYVQKAEIDDMIGKRLRKQFEDYYELYKIDGVEVDENEAWMNAPMTFDAEDVEEDMEEHNDPLVIILPVEGCNVKKILIDGGSSVNVLFYDTFKRMKLNDEQLMSSYYTIYGFNDAPTKPLGDIVLEVKAGPMNIETRFSVVDTPSPYNAIIGRRWVHKLKGVATTYHQYLRFPTPEGVMEIKGDQVTARKFQALQNQLNNEQDEQRKSHRNKNKAASKDKAIDLYLEEISGKSLTKENIVLTTEAGTSVAKGAEEPTK
ncbi:uncharacterized protein LOC113330467 [Papaver somniferum]|uniref:uncharacterized protein LOC113330467 n=1 Tax=Papaver somniferum TaxID=3469 RepID=UPI000E6F9B29|nr:uncharacterized protein LOC113330467 [Papaver somniferum]